MVVWGVRKGKERGITKGHKKRIWGDVCVHYLDDDDGFRDIYIWQNINLYTLNMCDLLL